MKLLHRWWKEITLGFWIGYYRGRYRLNAQSTQCTVADRETNGRYYCTRRPEHGGPCAAVPRDVCSFCDCPRTPIHDKYCHG